MLETAEEFHEVNDLMMRHTTLTATNQDLKDQQEQTALLAEQTRWREAVALPCTTCCTLSSWSTHHCSPLLAVLQAKASSGRPLWLLPYQS